MRCGWTQNHLRAFEEGELKGLRRLAVKLHLQFCNSCFEEYDERERSCSPLTRLAAPVSPYDLRTNIRIQLSMELARVGSLSWYLDRWKSQLRDLMQPLAIRAIGGGAAASLLLGIMVANLWSGPRMTVDEMPDIPLTYMARGIVSDPGISDPGPYSVNIDTTVLVYINHRGAVYRFDLPEAQQGDAKLRAEVAQALLFTEFEPATVFGQPVPGRVTIMFTTASCTVRG